MILETCKYRRRAPSRGPGTTPSLSVVPWRALSRGGGSPSLDGHRQPRRSSVFRTGEAAAASAPLPSKGGSFFHPFPSRRGTRRIADGITSSATSAHSKASSAPHRASVEAVGRPYSAPPAQGHRTAGRPGQRTGGHAAKAARDPPGTYRGRNHLGGPDFTVPIYSIGGPQNSRNPYFTGLFALLRLQPGEPTQLP
jgi:hypothetical protein